jgi:hypothetical protein
MRPSLDTAARVPHARQRSAPRAKAPSPLKVGFAEFIQALRTPELFFWALFLIATPFYVLRNGRPQPADFVTLLILPLLMREGLPKLPPIFTRAVRAVFAFAIYVAIVNLLWGLLLIDYNVQKVGAIGFAAFYLFNAYVFTLCVLLYAKHRARFFSVTAWAMIIAIVLQIALFVLIGGHGNFREKLYFNNPNQLGYYSLLAASLIAFGYKRGGVPYWLAACGLATTTLFAALSLSKAAIIGTITVACVAAVRKPLLLLVTAGVLLIGAQVRDPGALIEKVEYRMNDMGSQGDDTLEGRGYSRIEMHPEYLVLGAGEVGHDRHGDFGGELHSSWATVLFSYGAVGFLLLVYFFWRALGSLRPLDYLFLVPTFWYGLTHQGLRFRLFWVFIAFVAVAAYHEIQEERRRRRPAPLRAVPRRRERSTSGPVVSTSPIPAAPAE